MVPKLTTADNNLNSSVSIMSSVSSMSRNTNKSASWEDRIHQFVEYAAIEDRTYRFQKYRQTFVGKEMVDSLLYHKLVKTRREAVIVGRVLERDYDLFEHAGGPCANGTGVCPKNNVAFSDAAFLYRFNLSVVKKYVENYDETVATWASNVPDEEIVGSIREEESEYGAYDFEDKILGDVNLEKEISKLLLQEEDENETEKSDKVSPLDGSIHTNDLLPPRHPGPIRSPAKSRVPSAPVGSPTSVQDDVSLWSSLSTLGFMHNPNLTDAKMKQAQEFIRIARFLKRDRYYHMRKYKDVFVGSELVKELVKEGVVKTKSEAVQLGRQLEKDLSLFRHVCGDHRFDDVFYFYRFRPRVLELLGEQEQVRESQQKLYSSLWS